MKIFERAYIIDGFIPNNLKIGDYCIFERMYGEEYPIKVHCNGFPIAYLDLVTATILTSWYDNNKLTMTGIFRGTFADENEKLYHYIEINILIKDY